MLFVTDQSGENVWRIANYHLQHDADENVWYMVGYDIVANDIIVLGVYNFYRQAIDVFARMDYKENDLMYFKKQQKEFVMPPNITDPKECVAIYGNLY